MNKPFSEDLLSSCQQTMRNMKNVWNKKSYWKWILKIEGKKNLYIENIMLYCKMEKNLHWQTVQYASVKFAMRNACEVRNTSTVTPPHFTMELLSSKRGGTWRVLCNQTSTTTATTIQTTSKSTTSTLAYQNKPSLVLMRLVGQRHIQAQAFLEQLPVRHHDTLWLASGLTSQCVVPSLWEILVKLIIWVPSFFRRAAFLDKNTLLADLWSPVCSVHRPGYPGYHNKCHHKLNSNSSDTVAQFKS